MREVPTLHLNVGAQDFAHHAYQRYAELRELAPVVRVTEPDETEIWLVTRYADARRLLGDARLAKDYSTAHQALTNGGFLRLGSPPASALPMMLFSDPPDHDRLRRLVQRAFTPRRIARLEGRIDEITRELLDAMESRGETDLISQFALPLPIRVICELVGVPREDEAGIRHWTDQMLGAGAVEETDESNLPVEANIYFYLAGLVQQVADKVRPELPEDQQPNLLHALIAARDGGDQMSPQELSEMLVLLLVAGHETTVNLIGNGMLALLRNPEQLRTLRENPDLIPGAVEEFLRYDGPIERSTFRHSLAPIQIGEYEIPAQRVVGIVLASADRDPEQFPEPDHLDVTRAPAQHLAFGHGIHFCLGAPLARLEGRIAFTRLLERFPDIALARPYEQLEYRTAGFLSRSLTALPVWPRARA